MGCGASTNRVSTERERENTNSTSVVAWKILPSESEARKKFIADGTLKNTSEFGHLELRTILEDPISQNSLGRYANSIKVLDVFMCWVDIQEYKSIPSESYRRSKALHIYHKYIKPDATLMIPKLSFQEREQIRETLTQSRNDPSLLTEDFYNNAQHICFEAMYHSIFVPFRNTIEYIKLKERIKKKYNRVKLKHFDFYEKIGEGGFGFVVHCRKKSTGKHYAMKIQLKSGMIQSFHDNPAKANIEKLAFVTCQHPFIVRLEYAFQTDSLAMMVLELSTAGDLNKSLLNSPKQRLPEDRVRFYVAEIILALAYLHQMNLIYRDLKPQNVLLRDNGHIQLVDLGGIMDLSGDTLGQKKELEEVLPLFSMQYDPKVFGQSPAEDYVYEEVNEEVPTDKILDDEVVRNTNIKAACEVKLEENNFGGEPHEDEVYNQLLNESMKALDEAEKVLKSPKNVEASITQIPLEAKSGSPTHHSHSTHKKKKYRRKMSVMGTLGYMAPEMVLLLSNKTKQMYGDDNIAQLKNPKILTRNMQKMGYNTAVDWWSLGSTMFKLLTGSRPFVDSDFHAFVSLAGTLEAVVKENEHFVEYSKLFQKLSFPDYISDEAKDLLRRLLDVNPETRLGTGPNGLKNLKAHPFFADIDWNCLEAMQVEPPYIPPSMIEELDSIEPYESLEALLVDHGKQFWLDDVPPPEADKHFVNWDFTSPHTIRVEAGLSKMMDQYDKNVKVQRLMGSAKDGLFQSHTSLLG